MEQEGQLTQGHKLYLDLLEKRTKEFKTLTGEAAMLDDETVEDMPHLIAINRLGFLTHDSQPGEVEEGFRDGMVQPCGSMDAKVKSALFVQRAYVIGVVPKEWTKVLADKLSGKGYIVAYTDLPDTFKVWIKRPKHAWKLKVDFDLPVTMAIVNKKWGIPNILTLTHVGSDCLFEAQSLPSVLAKGREWETRLSKNDESAFSMWSTEKLSGIAIIDAEFGKDHSLFGDIQNCMNELKLDVSKLK